MRMSDDLPINSMHRNSINQVKEPFGEFSQLTMDENRLLLGGGASAAPGNQGNFLSQGELNDLNNCLASNQMYIYPQEIMNKLHLQTYGKSLENCNHHSYPVVSWQKGNKRNNDGYSVIKEEQALRAVSEGVNYQEQMDFQKHKQLLALIEQMRERNTKANIENLTTEFNKIWLQMTGKIQMIPLYKINKILDGIKNEK